MTTWLVSELSGNVGHSVSAKELENWLFEESVPFLSALSEP